MTTYWTKERIVDGVKEVIDNTNLDRMPTSSEVSAYYKNYKLSNAISKRRLWKTLAEELELEIKDCETAFGKNLEAKACETLVCMGYEVEMMAQNFPYDLLVEGGVKVDVKASKLYKGTSGNFYAYNLEKSRATCDIYILYVIDSMSRVKDCLIVPSKFVSKQNQIIVGEHKSKYYKFSDRWDYLEKMVDFNESL